jgi:ABC-type dipeptide/oligopeptide/nickel transport system permease component
MIDVFDIMAFIVFIVLIVVAVIIVVALGQLPGKIAAKRGHPQAAAINVTSWLGVATLGFLWPVALIWAFLKPVSLSAKTPENQEAQP